MEEKKQLRKSFIIALIALLIAFTAISAASFAWYVYNSANRTTKIHMAAGTSVNLQISNAYDGSYASSTVLESFTGLLEPVSTDNILNGFQKVDEFVNGDIIAGKPARVASTFFAAETYDYYSTSLFLRTNAETMDIYLSDIGFENSDSMNPISTAIRIGFVVHHEGQNQPVEEQYIYQIDQSANPQALYNTENGSEGDVLDSTKTDGSVVSFEDKLLSTDNYCVYDVTTGIVSLKADSVKLCTLTGSGEKAYGEPVQVDIYIWLEGCDKDCVGNLSGTTLRNIALGFGGDKT